MGSKAWSWDVSETTVLDRQAYALGSALGWLGWLMRLRGRDLGHLPNNPLATELRPKPSHCVSLSALHIYYLPAPAAALGAHGLKRLQRWHQRDDNDLPRVGGPDLSKGGDVRHATSEAEAPKPTKSSQNQPKMCWLYNNVLPTDEA